MKFLTDPVKRFELIETMLFDPAAGGFVLLDRHIERLATSARYFAYVYDELVVRRALDDAVVGKSGRLRVRLLLAEGGDVTVTTTPLPPADANAIMRFAVSASRVDSSDLFLFHKTTRRELYDREWQEYSERLGTDEVVYLNERGELAEGSRTTIFIERDGELLTPHTQRRAAAGHATRRTVGGGQGARGRVEARRSRIGGRGLPRQFGAWPRDGPSYRRAGVSVRGERGRILFDDNFVGGDGTNLRVGADSSPEHRGDQECKRRDCQHRCDDDLARGTTHAISV